MAETLSSNAMNYLGTFPCTDPHWRASLTSALVWRYLQEAGFGNAALQLARVWMRDPDTLPFAKHIEPHTLIRLVQDGMYLDRLAAETSNVRRIDTVEKPRLTQAD
jgi:transducin (beta)-like 1